MQQILTNPSLQRSLISTRAINPELVSCLKLSIVDSANNISKSVMLFHDMEYKFTFYDANTGGIQNLVGLVKAIYQNQIKIVYSSISENKCATCSKCNECANSVVSSNTQTEGMPTCSCVLNPPDYSRYNELTTYFIPVNNIIDVSYVTYSTNNNTSTESEESKEDIHVMLLGISATIVRAIVIKLSILDDSLQDAARYVELRTNGIYDLTYECMNGTIYESRVKVVKIEEVDDGETDCKPGRGFVREHVGHYNAVYTSCTCSNSITDDFMNDPPVRRVRITVDTSETFTGRYEVIPLSAIRDCILVQGPNPEDEEFSCMSSCDGCPYKTEYCDPCNCGHFIEPPKKPGCECNNPQSYTYTYDNKYKVTVNGETATISVKGEEHDVPLNEILAYYLGVDGDTNCGCSSN